MAKAGHSARLERAVFFCAGDKSLLGAGQASQQEAIEKLPFRVVSLLHHEPTVTGGAGAKGGSFRAGSAVEPAAGGSLLLVAPMVETVLAEASAAAVGDLLVGEETALTARTLAAVLSPHLRPL
jgi:hypothetical protein